MYQKKRWLIRVVPFISLWLAACSTVKPTDPGQSITSLQWQQHQQGVNAITHYETRGSFGWLSDKQRISARFNWLQTAPERYRLLLTNPLGSRELQLDVQDQVVLLVDNKGKQYKSNDAGKMISQLTGMDIPLESLRQWILGLPGGATDYQLNHRSQLRQLKYQRNGQQWQVNWLHYDNHLSPAMPTEIELHTETQRIKLRMDSWRLQ